MAYLPTPENPFDPSQLFGFQLPQPGGQQSQVMPPVPGQYSQATPILSSGQPTAPQPVQLPNIPMPQFNPDNRQIQTVAPPVQPLNPQPPGGQQGPAPAPAPAASADPRAGIQAAYRQHLGREATEADLMHWVGNQNYAAEIAASPEAKARAAGQPFKQTYNPMLGFEQGKLNDPSRMSPKYQFGRAMQEFGGWSRGNLQPLVDYFNQKTGGKARVVGEDLIDMGVPGWGPIDIIKGDAANSPQWLPMAPGGGPGGGGPGGRGPGGGPGGPQVPGGEIPPGAGAAPGLFGTEFLNKQYADLIEKLSQPYKMGYEQFESLRSPIDAARRVQSEQAMADLADRGLLSEFGGSAGGGGQAAGSSQFIERNIAPTFASAVQRAATEGQQLQTQNLQQMLGLGTQRQNVLGDMALRNLAQNQDWLKFLANFGLTQEQVRAQIQQGNTDVLARLLQVWQQGRARETDTQYGYNNQPPPGA